MRHILSLSAVAVALAFTACDNIDEKDRYIRLDFQETEKVILAEEFTGANCPNCPTGAEVMAGLHETYGGNFIVVSLYPKQLANLTEPKNVDLRTQVASDIFEAYNQENILPCAMFNRTKIDGKVLQATKPEVWGATVYNLFNNPDDKFSPCDIALSSTYNPQKKDPNDPNSKDIPETRILTVNYKATFKHAVDQNVSFQVYILENGIVSRQAGPNGLLPRYVNNHVLRTALNDTWGKEFGGNHAVGSSIEGSASITLPETWNADNIQVVGFVCNTGGDRQVLHAAMLKSIIPATEE